MQLVNMDNNFAMKITRKLKVDLILRVIYYGGNHLLLRIISERMMKLDISVKRQIESRLAFMTR